MQTTSPIRTTALALLLILCCAHAAPAQEAMQQLFSPTMGQMSFSGHARAQYQPSRDFKSDPGSLGSQEYELGLMAPLSQSDTHELGLTFSATHSRWDTRAVLPDSGMALPDELWNLSFGGLYRKKLDSGWIISGLALVGSDSDKPFNSYDETALTALAVARMPVGKEQAWLFMLAYSNTSDFLAGLPIPGVAWSYQPSRTFALLLGVPASSVFWMPNPETTLTFFYMFPYNINARAGYKVLKDLEVFVAFRWLYDSYFLADREDSDKALFVYEKKGVAGATYSFSPKLSLTLSAAWVFDRLMFQGEDFADTSHDRMELEGGPQLSATLRFNF